jgi:hypothetical protein
VLQTRLTFFARRYEELEMQVTLTIEDIMRIFRLAKVSVYRRLREMREGRDGGLPPPIPSGPKQRLRWNPETVMEFLESTDSTPQKPTLPIESETQRAARNRAALRELEKFGIKIPRNEQKQ